MVHLHEGLELRTTKREKAYAPGWQIWTHNHFCHKKFSHFIKSVQIFQLMTKAGKIEIMLFQILKKFHASFILHRTRWNNNVKVLKATI